MSNRGTDDRRQRIMDAVSNVWILTKRDDLLNDCISYVKNNYSYSYEIKDLVIEYLSLKCADAMSEADLDALAITEGADRMLESDLNAMALDENTREEIEYEDIRGV
jgi:hypothetical protein|tara:strand:+ start:196 stop:516 length:321 start_codon:yes stop_codon:yes gene_type:complete